MKILVLSDRESDYLWGNAVHSALKDIDLILSCGDLNPQYLSFLATFSHSPVMYVHGNHDDRYKVSPPEGCECIDGRLVTYKGLRILGLGGSVRYTADGEQQYTQRQMDRRVQRLWFQLRRSRGFDILLTHAAAHGVDDAEDWAHRGFEAFTRLLDRWHPAYFIHGHCHLCYSMKNKRLSTYNDTCIINAYEKYVLDTDPK